MGAKHIAAIVVGVVFVVIGVASFFVIGSMQKQGFVDALTLDGPDDPTTALLKDPRKPDAQAVYQDVYVFNLTNVAAVKAGTEKPNLVEVGPFRYRVYVSRPNMTFSADGLSVDLQEKWEYEFVPTADFPSDTNVTITNINGFYPTVVAGIPGGESTLNLMLVSGVLLLMNGNEAAWGANATFCAVPGVCSLAKATAGAITFNAAQSTAMLTTFRNATLMLGYIALTQNLSASQAAYGPVMNAYYSSFGIDHTTALGLNQAQALMAYLAGLASTARALTALQLGLRDGMLFRTLSARRSIFGPDPFLSAVAGVTSGLLANASVLPTSTLETGKRGEPYMNMDYYTQVRGKRWTVVYGPNTTCEGRSSSVAPFLASLPDSFEVYSGEVQRWLPVVRGAEVMLYDLPLQRYDIAWDKLFIVDPTWKNPYAGMINVGPAAGGSPVFMGFPNFGPTTSPAAVNTPAWIRDAVTGVNSSHAVDSFLDVEPMSGLPGRARKAVQVNMLINVTGLQDVPSMHAASRVLMLPVIWSAQLIELSPSAAELFYKGTIGVRNLKIALIVVFVGLGALLVVLGVAFLVASAPASDEKYADAEKTATPQS